MDLVEAVRADLVWIAHYWPDLSEARLAGPTRIWRQPHQITGEQAEERDHQLRIERWERLGLMPGEHLAPIDLGVVDTMRAILLDAVFLADEVAGRTLWVPPGPPSTAYADPRPYLDYTAHHIPAELASWAAPIVRGMVDQIAQTLALVLDGQTLPITCPWCNGITADAPAGGAKTWHIRVLPGDQIAIVCEGGACVPPAKDVGTWWGGRPCWPLSTWAWLAKRVHAADARERIAS